VGSQIYECRASDEGGWARVIVAPEADLLTQKEEKVGTHGAGPNWAALDGSQTVGTVKARAAGERPADIPLLLLTAKSAATPGKMAAVTSVQRLNTEGGNAPATGLRRAGRRRQTRQARLYRRLPVFHRQEHLRKRGPECPCSRTFSAPARAPGTTPPGLRPARSR
jgi:hypothetical protein